MAGERVQRRLAAILAADVVGYSAMMERAIRRMRSTVAWNDNPTFLAGRKRIIQGMRVAGLPEG